MALGLMLVRSRFSASSRLPIAAWFVDRLQEVEDSVEESTDATLEQVLAELREVRARLDAYDDARR